MFGVRAFSFIPLQLIVCLSDLEAQTCKSLRISSELQVAHSPSSRLKTKNEKKIILVFIYFLEFPSGAERHGVSGSRMSRKLKHVGVVTHPKCRSQ